MSGRTPAFGADSGERNRMRLGTYRIGTPMRRQTPVVIVIDAEAMARDGAVFYLSENGVWLCDHVAPEYFLDPEPLVK